MIIKAFVILTTLLHLAAETYSPPLRARRKTFNFQSVSDSPEMRNEHKWQTVVGLANSNYNATW
jgi:hypothetical protein